MALPLLYSLIGRSRQLRGSEKVCKLAVSNRWKKGLGMRHQLKTYTQSGLTLSNYIAVMGLLNAILERVSHSLPQIKEAIRMLPEGATALNTGAGGIGESSVQR